MSEFNLFMKNSYWKELYDKASENVKEYLKLKWEYNSYEEYPEEIENKIKGILEKFTKSDWEELIAQSHGRAKYEYTRMMKEKFPEPGNPLYEGKGEEE